MNKVWFILINSIESGPYSIADLKLHPQFTPDTLVRKKDQSHWVLARYVSELQEVFKDEPKNSGEIEETKTLPSFPLGLSEDLVIDYREDPPPFYFFLLITFILLIYFLIRFIY